MGRATASVAGRDTPLTPDVIVEVADRLLADDGVDAFSMRRLAHALGVNPMTIYLRFQNKDELLDAVVARAVAGFVPPVVDPADPWPDRALVVAAGLRAHLRTNRHLLPLLSGSGRLAATIALLAEQGLGLATELGHDDTGTVATFRVLFWHVLGFATSADPAAAHRPERPVRELLGDLEIDQLPTVAAHLGALDDFDADALFALSTRLLVDGLWSRRPAAQPPTRSPATHPPTTRS